MYNEKKVQKKTATFIDAGYYLQKPELLSVKEKFERLKSRNALNMRSKVNVMSCSISFDEPKKLTAGQLKQISLCFLKKLGFASQPYLLYEHHDSARQHVHIVSTLIRPDGSRIRDSVTTRSKIIEAQKHTQALFGLKSTVFINPDLTAQQKAAQDQTQGLRSKLRSVIDQVLSSYKFSSFSEYNAVLRQFNVQALSGSVHSRLFKHQGLLYKTIDHKGSGNSMAIKASRLDPRATLKALDLQFKQNAAQQKLYISRLKNTVDLAIVNSGELPLAKLAELLEKQGIKMHLTTQADQKNMHLTYVDNRTKCAFDASRLGPDYDLYSLAKRCAPKTTPGAAIRQSDSAVSDRENNDWELFGHKGLFASADQDFKIDVLLHDLLLAATDHSPVPFALRNAMKKRRKRSTAR
ncbi:relaxase/mobilization nuclease domain-containing protein [Dyadobacter sp. CY356]|uniref:relaxase/mobilization nuclease domain-containing protein n=1 Tax=Dyadobacter sp. CY356 TaxID=2906442 RepID=UPI001F33AEC9|nr:relaxase/mobilization nuclease domain-containing protein [Dyadobacter sp. CY356]MCF0055182.1 relaxase/mobilization nuclease domain-containing protein [Dyadobacter sp. CY356]